MYGVSVSAADGTSVADLVVGRPYYRPAGVEHEVRNANDYEFAFVEVEVKPRPAATG